MRPIDELREKIDLWKKSTTDTALMSVLHDVLKQIDVAIYEMDHQEAESTWHRVDEELPKYGDWVLCLGPKGGYYVSEYRGVSGLVGPRFHANGRYINATHWMPIEPPREEA